LYPFVSSLLLCSLSFYSSLLLPYLHSFPTRRSSDLGFSLSSLSLGAFAGQLEPRLKPRYFRRPIDSLQREHRRCRSHNEPTFLRSEEHTSELQSPDHLVCRLLLEKKTKHNTNVHITT